MKRKVLITGTAGFIGSRLSEHLNALGYEVLGCDIYNFRNQFFDVGDSNHLILQRLRYDRIAHFLQKNQIQYQPIDLSDHGAVMALFESFQPDVVVHLAAQAGVRHSVKSPMDFVKSNLNGFANVLDACKKYEVQEFLYASSSSVYGARTDAPFQETDRCDTPESFYAATKMANELMAQAYFAQYKTPSLGLRFFTVYGPWGRLDMAPLLFAQKMRKKQPIQLFGDGLLKRDFTYIDDTIFALSRLIELGISRHGVDVVNVGHSNPIQVTEFVKILSECLGIEPVVELAPMQVSDVPLTCASDLKLVKLIGEWPHTSMKDGLAEMAKWLLNWQPA
ncbi:MAG: NAD-dependent epimerase/dehydratase family protein [Betaproteobacteria bacterium]